MPAYFLQLDLDNFGIRAKIIEQSYKHNLIKEQCHILFEDLPDSTQDLDTLDSGIEVIAQRLNLELCTTSVIFVSPLLVSFRNIALPFSTQKKAKQVLPFELESLLPVTNEPYISDFHMLMTSLESNLLLSASFTESIIAKYFNTLESVGIKPLIITPKGYAAAVSFLKKNNNTITFIFLHITDSEITFVLVKDRIPCIVRAYPAFQNSPEDLVNSIKQTVIGFNQRTGVDISFDIFVCSDKNTFEVDHIYETFEKHLGSEYGLNFLEQRIKKPVTQERIDSDTLLTDISPEQTVKYLFNFCKGKYGTNSFIKTYFPSIAVSVGLSICVLVLLMLSVGFDNAKLNKKISAVDDKAFSIFKATFPNNKKIHDPYLQMKANVKNAVKKYNKNGYSTEGTNSGNIKIVTIMNELSNKITSVTDMEISNFLFRSGRIILSGSTDNFNNVDNIKTQIESSLLFKKVSISSAAADKNGKRVNVKFIIQI